MTQNERLKNTSGSTLNRNYINKALLKHLQLTMSYSVLHLYAHHYHECCKFLFSLSPVDIRTLLFHSQCVFLV